MAETMLDAIQREYSRLTKQDTPLYNLHPELAGRERIITQKGPSVLAEPEMKEYADYATVYGSYIWVRKAIGLIADTLASLTLNVVDANGEAIEGHPLTALFGFVNDSYDAGTLWAKYIIHMMLGGEGIIEIVPDGNGNPVELWGRRPNRISVVPDTSPERVWYPRVAAYIMDDEDEAPIEPENMIFDRFVHPSNDFRGLAPIAAVRGGIIIDLFAQAWSKLFLKRGARPDYWVIAPEGITTTEREAMEAELMAKYGGPDGWHKPGILEQGITDVKTVSYPPKDIEWLQQREFSRDEVAAIFGVPDEIMGFGRDTYENFETAYMVFWLLTMKPLVDHRDNVLTRHFTHVKPILRAGESFSTDLSEVGVLQEDILPKLDAAEKFWNMGVPYNTVEERLGLGTGPIPGGDIGYLPLNLIPAITSRAPDANTGNGPANSNGTQSAPSDTEPPEGDTTRSRRFSRKTLSDTDARALKRAIQAHQNIVLRALRDERYPDWHGVSERAERAFLAAYPDENAAASMTALVRADFECAPASTEKMALYDQVSTLYAAVKETDLAVLLQFAPAGADEPLPAMEEVVDITSADVRRAIVRWNAFMREPYEGMLEAEVV